jgi:hypothetical protein
VKRRRDGKRCQSVKFTISIRCDEAVKRVGFLCLCSSDQISRKTFSKHFANIFKDLAGNFERKLKLLGSLISVCFLHEGEAFSACHGVNCIIRAAADFEKTRQGVSL